MNDQRLFQILLAPHVSEKTATAALKSVQIKRAEAAADRKNTGRCSSTKNTKLKLQRSHQL